jgi:adenylate cyclase
MKDKGGHFLRNKFLRGAAIGLAVFAVTAVIWGLGVFRSLEWKSWDARLRLGADPSRAATDIVLLAVDQPSLDAFNKQQGLPWPWPRQMYAAVLDFLKAGGAQAVFFDLILTEPSGFGVEDDSAFDAAIARSGNVFLPFSLSKDIREEDPAATAALGRFALARGSVPPRAIQPYNSVTLPVEELMKNVRGMGNVQLAPDGDSVYRRVPLVFAYKGLTLPGLPLALAEQAEAPLDLGRIPLDRSGQMILRFHGPAGTYKTYSIAAVINSQAQIEEGTAPQIEPGEFAGKTVIVGTTAPGLYDLRPTPFGGIYPGMEILATTVDNLIHGDHVRPVSAAVTAGWILALSLLAGLGTTLLKKIWHLAVLLLFVLALPASAAWLTFRAGVWLDFAAPLFAVLAGFITASLLDYGVEGRQRRFIKSVFRFYLSPDVIDRVLENPGLLKLGGERREITAFFSDLAGFTSISEGLSPEALVGLLNAYLSEMTDIILGLGGTLDKYEGDAIIAFWNSPLDQPDHALRACRAALRCQKRLAELREEFKRRSGHEVRMRIGLSSGPAVVGNMGSERRFDYTAMGDTMNLASRLEGACKAYKIFTLVSEETASRVRDEIVTREADMVLVVGKKRPIRIFELIGEKDDVAADGIERISRFHAALEAYRAGQWARARPLFEALAGDPVAEVYAGRCRSFADSPPPGDWDGVYEIKEK